MNWARHRRSARVVSVIGCAVLFAFGALAGAKPQDLTPGMLARLGREFELKTGRQVTVKKTRLQIRFIAVENDSRCPKDVTCVWAGNAAVKFQLGSGRGRKIVTLNTSHSNQFVSETNYHGYKVSLVDLKPYPRSSRKIAARDYTAILRVIKE